jgi:Ca2+-binding RTX toxin-like protein
MTGNVAAVVDASGNLAITGDAQDNGITLTQTAANTFVVTGDATTTVNGQALGVAATLANVTRGFKIEMLQGNDSLTVQNLTVPKNFKFEGGDGNDTLLISNVMVRGNVDLEGNSGTDTLTLTQVDARRKISIDGGDGTDAIDVNQSSAHFLLVNSRRGKDTVARASNDFDATLITNRKWSNKVADIVFHAWENAV